MAKDDNRPADTTMMGVVHDALRRDLARLDEALAGGTPIPIDDNRARALAAHTEWMMQFLHRHHRAEDDGLWPLLRARAPHTGELLDRMEADHERVVPAIAAVEQAAARYRERPGEDTRDRLAHTVDSLSDTLLPHLRSEEDEAMPMVSAALSEADWKAWDKKFNIGGKSLNDLAMDGHWLMDGLDPERYQVLIHLVPAPARVIIVKGFARRYRKACAVRWGSELEVGPLRQSPRGTGRLTGASEGSVR